MHASQIMKTQMPRLRFDQTISEAINILKLTSVGFALVQATEDRVQGVITHQAVLRMYIKNQVKKNDKEIIFYREYLEQPQYIHQKEDLTEIIKKIITAPSHRVFVIDDSQKVIGYISSSEIFDMFLTTATDDKSSYLFSKDQLESQLFLFESFFNKSPLMMHSIDSEGNVQIANEALHYILGYEYGQMIGLPLSKLYPPSIFKKAQEGLHDIIDHDSSKIVKSIFVTKNNTEIKVELVSKSLKDSQGKIIGTMTISRPEKMEDLLKVFHN